MTEKQAEINSVIITAIVLALIFAVAVILEPVSISIPVPQEAYALSDDPGNNGKVG